MFHQMLFSRIAPSNGTYKTFYLLCLMIFFWAIFDGGFSYMVPVVITQNGYSETFMGFIYASSSIFGAAFDIFLSKFLKSTHFRRVFILMFVLCSLCPALLIKGMSIWFYLTAMALWGFYYDLSNFGTIDFISRRIPAEEHSTNFGILWVFKQLGYTIAPLIIGVFVIGAIDYKPYAFLWGCLIISCVFFLLVLVGVKKQKVDYLQEDLETKPHRVIPEMYLWKKIGRLLMPVLILTCFLWTYDAFFWTIGPLMKDILHNAQGFGGLFLTLYTTPVLIFGFIVGKVNKHIGKKRTALLACLLGSSLLCGFFFVSSPYIILLLVLLSSCCIAFCLPSLNAAYTDYVSESSQFEKEIEALQDFSTNIGYIIGPLLAGFLADKFGNVHSFGYLGVIGIIISVSLLLLTPRHINIRVK